MDESYVSSLISGYGEEPTACRVARDWSADRSAGESKGYAIVQLRSTRAAAIVLAKSGGIIPACFSQKLQVRSAHQASHSGPSFFVGGMLEMPWVCPDFLRFVFTSEDTDVKVVHLPKDDCTCHERGWHYRGFGFVTLATEAAVQRTLTDFPTTNIGVNRPGHPVTWGTSNLNEVHGGGHEESVHARRVRLLAEKVRRGVSPPPDAAVAEFPRVDESPLLQLTEAQKAHIAAKNENMDVETRLELANQAIKHLTRFLRAGVPRVEGRGPRGGGPD